ncbi:hypothetical protein ACLB2K_030500 [Fragaria x ananassa]
MSHPNNNENLGSSSDATSNPAVSSANYNPISINSLFNQIAFRMPAFPNITSFPIHTQITVYEFNYQPAPAHLYNFVNSGTANNAGFHGLLNDGARGYFLSHQQNLLSFGTLGPRAPVEPFFSIITTVAPSNYEGSSTQAPRGMSSSISLGGRRRPREAPLVMRQTPDAAKREITEGDHRCQECGREFRSGSALGGHMSHHSKRRRREHERAFRRLPEEDP